jgi:acetyl-CoA carboxylase biotin carboxyl carrier protein
VDWNELKELIQELMGSMSENDLSKLKIKYKDCELELEKSGTVITSVPVAPPPVVAHHLPSLQGLEVPSASKEEEGCFIEAPVVGTFYSASSPEDSDFVKVGDVVDESSVVGIVEAMKVMNEVKAGIRGEIIEILVENAQAVEFGTPLFRIR